MFEQLGGNWGTFPWKFKNFGCPKGVHFTPLFVKLAKNYICYKGEY